MYKTIKMLSLIAIVSFLALPAMVAAVTEDSDSAPVTLTIEQFCEIGYGETSFDITLSGGVSGGSDSENYSAGANFNANITGVLTPPTDAPGDWSFDIDGSPSVTFGPGTHSGTVTVTVDNVGLADGTYTSSDGTMVITVSLVP